MRIADIERQVEDHFSKLDEKLTVIFEKIFSNHVSLSNSIESHFSQVEERFNIINEKISNLEASKKEQDVEQNTAEPLQLNVMNTFFESLNIELVTKLEEVFETIEEINKKIEQNKNLLIRNYEETMKIKENLHNRQERSQRGHDLDHIQTELINDILTVVRKKLKDRTQLLKNERSSTLTIISQKSQQKSNNQTTAGKLSSTRKGGIIYPISMKNILPTPTNESTAFESDRDIKVIILYCFASLPFHNANICV